MRSTRPTISGLAGLASLAILATACTSSAPGKDPAQPTPAGGTAASPASTEAPTATPPPQTASPTLVPASPDAWLAVGRKGRPDLEVILASTREVMYADLPLGVPTRPDWGQMITSKPDGAKTVVRNVTVQPDLPGPSTTLDGAWRLPTIGPDPMPVGVSADGQTIVLVEAGAPASKGSTRFAILSNGVVDPARIVELPGRFDYDALSPDGTVLYVVEHLDTEAGGRYQVRAVDLATGTLRDGVIVDKRNIDEAMAGYPLAQVRRSDGGVLTLYRGLEHPFIHALNSVEGWAICIDLPATGADDAAAAADWGLAQAPDGQAAYAINATLGLVAELDPTGFGILRSTSVKPLAGSGIVLAKFGHEESGPVGRRVVVGPDGRTIYAAGAGGILAIDAASLKVGGTFEAGEAVDGLAVTPDGGTLYALLHAGGRIVKLDAASGKLLATVPGDGYDRLVAVVPW